MIEGTYPPRTLFGKWETLDWIRRPHHIAKVLCRCSCGFLKEIEVRSLLRGKSSCCKSCSKLGKTVWIKHGEYGTPTYVSYRRMINRCTNSNADNYRFYGGRGIRVCDRWLKSFENFKTDMGERPSLNFSIDRIDPNGHYEPLNCRWLLKLLQPKNRRNSREKMDA